ncbi:hypothetical protein LEMLEM_LOCUS15437, partial [Lemmus lemmus]
GKFWWGLGSGRRNTQIKIKKPPTLFTRTTQSHHVALAVLTPAGNTGMNQRDLTTTASHWEYRYEPERSYHHCLPLGIQV